MNNHPASFNWIELLMSLCAVKRYFMAHGPLLDSSTSQS